MASIYSLPAPRFVTETHVEKDPDLQLEGPVAACKIQETGTAGRVSTPINQCRSPQSAQMTCLSNDSTFHPRCHTDVGSYDSFVNPTHVSYYGRTTGP